LRTTGKSLLKEAGVDSYAIDADVLLMHVLGIDKNTLLISPDRPVGSADAERFMELINARCNKTPVQYLIGKCEFMSLEFAVNPHVLIPRPDTEVLVETILVAESNASGLEIGVGTGCISISLEHYGNNITMHGVDISPEAVGVATHNAGKRIFMVSDLFDNVSRGTLFDFIVSNPPYIETEEIEGLDSGVKDFEPRLALDGGVDGLDFYRRIVKQAREYLVSDGRIYFEIGYNQARAAGEILAAAGYVDIVVIDDYAGKNRVVTARRA